MRAARGENAADPTPKPMPPALRHTLLSTRDLLVTAGPFVLLAALLLGLAYWALDPTPPKKVVLATGPANGAYAEFGQRYQAQLKKFGIQVKLRGSEGSSENLRLLEDAESGVDFAFVQGGAGRLRSGEDEAPPDLVSLGSLFYEPLWVFYREASAQQRLKRERLDKLSELKGWRVNIGAKGSGITNLMKRVLSVSGLEPEDIVAERMSQTPAVMALLDGSIDALALVSAPEAPMVQLLLQTPGIRLLDFAQAEAYTRRLPMLAAVRLPRGVVKLDADLPPQDVDLLAPTAMLVAKPSSHPALQRLFVQAANTIHSEAGWFQTRREFPNRRATELPMAREADRFFDTGPPFLQRYLPFWLANLIDRMWVVLAGVIVVLLPLSRVLPPLYELRVRSRVFRWYARLRQIEESLAGQSAGPQPLMEELDQLDARVKQLQVPLSYADELYALRGHIDLVRKKLRALGAQTPGPAA